MRKERIGARCGDAAMNRYVMRERLLPPLNRRPVTLNSNQHLRDLLVACLQGSPRRRFTLEHRPEVVEMCNCLVS